MIFFNADGSIRHEKNESTFGWIWKQPLKMIFYNTNGSVKSEEYYHNSEWENLVDIATKTTIEKKENDRNSEKKFQRMYSDIEDGNKVNLIDFLMQLNNTESRVLLSIISNTAFLYLENINIMESNLINYEFVPDEMRNQRTARLKRLYKAFNIEFNLEIFSRQYSFDLSGDTSYEDQVNKSIDDYIDEREELRNIFFHDDYQRETYTDVDSASKGIGIDKSMEAIADIDQTLLKLFDKTCEMHCEVEKIRKCFLKDGYKVESLIKKSENLRENLNKTKYLNDIILILDYKIEKLNHDWPFRIGRTNLDHSNLII